MIFLMVKKEEYELELKIIKFHFFFPVAFMSLKTTT
jgi:hypothetical protein